MSRVHANDYGDSLNGAITNVATSITVNSATGLPAIGAGESYNLTITYGENIEIVTVTDDASTPTLTVTRGAEGTTGLAFVDGSIVELNVTADSMDRKPDKASDEVITGNWDFGGAGSLEIPNGATPTLDAAGEIALDTTITDYTGMIKYHDGTEELTALALPTANLSTTDMDRVVYDATADELKMQGFIGFRANRSTTQSIATGTYTKIQLNNEEFDTEGDFDPTTNYRHTPTMAGKYLYIGSTSLSGMSADKSILTAIRKNGASVSESILFVPISTSPWMQSVAVVDMNGTTDYVELYILHDEGSNLNTQAASSVNFLVGTRLP